MALLRVLTLLACALQGLVMFSFIANPTWVTGCAWALAIALAIGLLVEVTMRAQRLRVSRILRDNRRLAVRLEREAAVFDAVMKTRKG